jgi:hypothetical protein
MNSTTLSPLAALSPLTMMKKLVQGPALPDPSEESELEQLRKRLAEVEARLEEKEQLPKRRKATP